MALSYNLGYQEIILVHPTRRQIFAGKPYSTFWNIWEWVVFSIYGNFDATKPNIWDCSAHCTLHHGKSHATKSKIRNCSAHCKLHCGWPGNLSARLFLTVSLDRWARRAHCIKRNTSTHSGQTLRIFKHRNICKYGSKTQTERETHIPIKCN